MEKEGEAKYIPKMEGRQSPNIKDVFPDLQESGDGNMLYPAS